MRRQQHSPMSTCMRGQSPPSTVSASTSATSAVLLRVHRISQAGPAVPFIHNGFFYSVAPRGRMTSGQLAHHGWDVVQQTAFQATPSVSRNASVSIGPHRWRLTEPWSVETVSLGDHGPCRSSTHRLLHLCSNARSVSPACR